MSDLVINPPSCDWAVMLPKDRRKKAFWLCRACGFIEHQRPVEKRPECPCKKHVLIPQETAK